MTIPAPTIDPADAAAAAARFAATADADVSYTVHDSPVGRLVLAATPRGLVRIAYELPNGGLDSVLQALAARLSPRILEAPGRLDTARRELDEYFAGRRTRFDLPVDLSLVAPFGKRVLSATAAIPFGETRTYAQIAALAGKPTGARATGNALAANPVPIVIPCHRVTRSGGGLGGYTGGLDVKRTLLSVEGIAI